MTSIQQYTLDKSEVIFEQGDCGIIRDDDSRGAMGYHIKCQSIDSDHKRMSWLAWEKPRCHYCRATVPDKIQTLVHLYTGR